MARNDIFERFQQELEGGAIVADGRIPTFRDLGSRYECSAATIKRMVDRLERVGRLRTVRGRGTFVTGAIIPPEQQLRQTIGCIVLDDQFQAELDRCKDEFLRRGWFFSIYNASRDAQSPEREKMFLEMAQEQAFSSVILEATPVNPVNRELFARLRSSGIKVIQLSPYCLDMSDECFFCPDFAGAGRLAVAKSAQKGYRKIVFVANRIASPYWQLVLDAASRMAQDLGLEVERKPLAEITFPETVSPHVALITPHTEAGDQVLGRAAESRQQPGRDFGLVSISTVQGHPPTHSHILHDYPQIMHEVLEYAIDQQRGAFDREQRLYPASFVDLKTL